MSHEEMLEKFTSRISGKIDDSEKAILQEITTVKREVKAIEQKVADVKREVSDHGQRIAQLEQRGVFSMAGEDEDFTKQLEELRRRVETDTKADKDIPYEARTLAIVRNLGWDTDAEELETRCADLLIECGLRREDFSGVTSTRRDRGSACEVIFKTPSLLQQARLLVKNKRRVYHGNNKAWLDAKRTRSENKPSQMMHRAHEMLEQIENGKGTARIALYKDPKSKSIKAGDRIVGFSKGSSWQWCESATFRYSMEELDMAKSYAEQP